jgi:hypothetical protein
MGSVARKREADRFFVSRLIAQAWGNLAPSWITRKLPSRYRPLLFGLAFFVMNDESPRVPLMCSIRLLMSNPPEENKSYRPLCPSSSDGFQD